MFHDVIGHEGPRAILHAAMRHDRVAHAYLFHGEAHIGKRFTAMRFAQTLNCEGGQDSESPDACGPCRSCLQIEAHTHPDFLVIEPDAEQANPQIKIEDIRGIEQHIIYRPLIGRWKIVLIDDADRMTIGAANALLKTLEEPPGHSIFLLITSRPSALPSTIQSRCQNLRFVPPPQTQVEAALILKRNIPPREARLIALATQCRIGLALHTDIAGLHTTQDEFHARLSAASRQSITVLLSTAESLAKSDRGAEALEWIAQWLRDLLLIAIGAPCELLLNAERMTELTALARSVQLDALLDLLADVEQIQHGSTRNINLQLALETLLLRLRGAMQPAATTPIAR